MELNVNADIVNLHALATRILEKIEEYSSEWKEMDMNDSDWEYFNGLISGYQSVATMIGVPFELVYPEENE